MIELLLLAQAAAAAVEAPAKPRSVITNPYWIRRPSGEDLARFYPKGAADRHVEGRATISCEVTEAGSLANCTVAGEEPAGEGFGAAAISLSTIFKMQPKTLDGQPVAGGTVRIPIRFVLPAKPPSLDEATRCYGAVSAATETDPTMENWYRMLMWGMLIGAHTAELREKPSVFEARLAEASAKGRSDPAASQAIATQCRPAEAAMMGPPKPR